MKKRLKINGVIIFCVFLMAVVFPATFLRKENGFSALDQVAEIVGISLMLLGQLLRASARGFKSEYSGNGHLLIQGGPY